MFDYFRGKDSSRVGTTDQPVGGEAHADSDATDSTTTIEHAQALGLYHDATVLAGFVRSCATPLTIGVQGDWGSGKTSLLQMIRDLYIGPAVDVELADSKTGKKLTPAVPSGGLPVTVWFNTWQYSQFRGAEGLGAAMIRNLTRQLVRSVHIEDKYNKIFQIARRLATQVARASLVVGGAVAGAQLGLSNAGEGIGQLLNGEDDSLDDAVAFERIRDEFALLVRTVTDYANTDRVVFFIDDLDRLPPVKAIELLEVCKTLLDVPRCVFVLAIDYDVIVKGLHQRKDYAGERDSLDGKSFFDKIIQVPYRMPVSRYHASNYMMKLIETMNFDTNADSDPVRMFLNVHGSALLRCTVGSNPRSIKRVLNLFTLTRELNRPHGTASTANSEHYNALGPLLLVLTALQVAHPDVYQRLVDARAERIEMLIAMLHLRDLTAADLDIDKQVLSNSLVAFLKRVYFASEGPTDAKLPNDEKKSAWFYLAVERCAPEVTPSAPQDDEILEMAVQWQPVLHALLDELQINATRRSLNGRTVRSIAELVLQCIDRGTGGVTDRGANDGWITEGEASVLDQTLEFSQATSVRSDEPQSVVADTVSKVSTRLRGFPNLVRVWNERYSCRVSAIRLDFAQEKRIRPFGKGKLPQIAANLTDESARILRVFVAPSSATVEETVDGDVAPVSDDEVAELPALKLEAGPRTLRDVSQELFERLQAASEAAKSVRKIPGASPSEVTVNVNVSRYWAVSIEYHEGHSPTHPDLLASYNLAEWIEMLQTTEE